MVAIVSEEFVEQVWECIATADSTLSNVEKCQALLAGMHDVEARLRLDPQDPELNFLMALLWYRWPNRTEEAIKETYRYLRDSIAQNPAHVGSLMHLGFQQFDDSRYSDALATFRKIDLASLGSASSSWQRLKVAELIICCELRLDWQTVAPQEVDRLREDYESFGEHGVAPAPVEITRSAIAVSTAGKAGACQPICEAVVRLITQVEGPGGGSLSQELKQLEGNLSKHLP
jgi:hypothetical protein